MVNLILSLKISKKYNKNIENNCLKLILSKNLKLIFYNIILKKLASIENILILLESYNYPLKSGLNYKNEFTFLIAILLSAQSKDSFINTQTVELFNNYDTPEKILQLGDNLYDYIKKIGLWRNKGRNILLLSNQIIALKEIKNLKNWYNSFFDQNYYEDDLELFGPILSEEGIPSFRKGLLSLSGIGRKSANVFLNVTYHAPVFPVDTHVIRLSNRLGISNTTNPFEIEKIFMEMVLGKYKNKICHYLVWHGRNVCHAKKPNCEACKLKKHCLFYKNGGKL